MEHARYTNELFELGYIIKFILQSKNNIVLWELGTSSFAAPEPKSLELLFLGVQIYVSYVY
jgi:hypothetical protein